MCFYQDAFFRKRAGRSHVNIGGEAGATSPWTQLVSCWVWLVQEKPRLCQHCHCWYCATSHWLLQVLNLLTAKTIREATRFAVRIYASLHNPSTKKKKSKSLQKRLGKGPLFSSPTIHLHVCRRTLALSSTKKVRDSSLQNLSLERRFLLQWYCRRGFYHGNPAQGACSTSKPWCLTPDTMERSFSRGQASKIFMVYCFGTIFKNYQ